MKEKILITLAVIMSIVSMTVMIVVGVLYFTQISENNTVEASVVRQNDTQAKGIANGKDEGDTPEDGKKPTNGTVVNEDTKDREAVNTETLDIVAAGDMLFGRSVRGKLLLQPTRYKYPFEKVVDFFKNRDIVFGNLEESITSSSKGLTGIKQGGKYVLKNDVEAIEGIRYAGFNLLSLANNHILDYYEKGLFDTVDTLNKYGIAYAGAGRNLEEARKLIVIQKKGLKIGMLAYTDMASVIYKGTPPLRFLATDKKSGVAPTDIEYIKEDISKARPLVDILIVSLHWGIEYTYEPTKRQIDAAHEIIDQGADVILGHHTHRFQSIEIYKDKPILYSLGNLMFDQKDPENQQGFIMEMKFKDKKLSYLAGLPFKIENVSQIVPQTGSDAAKMVNREIRLCQKMNTQSYLENDRIVFQIKK